jgi:predicted SnoaL-like aldol condensation-catalyzing enzyme
LAEVRRAGAGEELKFPILPAPENSWFLENPRLWNDEGGNRKPKNSGKQSSSRMKKEEKNKALVIEAFNTLFNQRDYAAAERFWSPNYIQHSAHIAPGREGLFNLIKSLPATLKHEMGLIVAEGDFVIAHGRFSGFGRPANWIAADILRIKDGVLVEHWDVLQDEATREESKSGNPMFGDTFGGER